jgi:HD superfamily phosphohydrolase
VSTETFSDSDEIMELNLRTKCDILKDSVHGYIRFTHNPKNGEFTEKDIIDSPWVQRLRRIKQLQSAWYVYPSADHSRFIHSLSVMELAGRFARAVYEPFWRRYRNEIDLPSPALVVETFRIAGLLHDVGHGPFSHLLDVQVLKPRFNLTHEKISGHLITNELSHMITRIRRTPDGDLLESEENVDPNIVASLLTTRGEKHLEEEFLWLALLPILRGAYDADKMDFLLRDGACCGLRGLDKHEIDRLVLTSFIARDKYGTPVFLLDSSSKIPLMAFLRQRQYLMNAVYFHRTVRAMERTITPALRWAAEQALPRSPIEAPEHYLDFDEYKLHALLSQAVNDKDEEIRTLGKTWKAVNERKIPWKQIYEHTEKEDKRVPALQHSAEDVVRRIWQTNGLNTLFQQESIYNNKIFVDIPVTNAPKEVTETSKTINVSLHDRQSGRITHVKPQEFEKGGVFPHLVFYRVYLHDSFKQHKPRILKSCEEAFGQSITDITSF